MVQVVDVSVPQNVDALVEATSLVAQERSLQHTLEQIVVDAAQ